MPWPYTVCTKVEPDNMADYMELDVADLRITKAGVLPAVKKKKILGMGAY